MNLWEGSPTNWSFTVSSKPDGGKILNRNTGKIVNECTVIQE